MKKTFFAVTALLMLCVLLMSCNGRDKQRGEAEYGENDILLSSISSYRIVLPKHASDAIKEQAETLKKYIVEATGI